MYVAHVSSEIREKYMHSQRNVGHFLQERYSVVPHHRVGCEALLAEEGLRKGQPYHKVITPVLDLGFPLQVL